MVLGMWGLIENKMWGFEWSRISKDGIGVLRGIASSSTLYTAESLGCWIVFFNLKYFKLVSLF